MDRQTPCASKDFTFEKKHMFFLKFEFILDSQTPTVSKAEVYLRKKWFFSQILSQIAISFSTLLKLD